ncbi:MAG: FmdE family protein [Desulfococcaceae bacterium]
MNTDFENLLKESVKFHGHLCGGQVVGIKMAIAGLRELGIRDPGGTEGRNLVIFTEIDRCAVDGIISVSKRTPGRRSIKIKDYGKTAATFVNTGTGKAVRVSVRADSDAAIRKLEQQYLPEKDEKAANIAALIAIPEEELLMIREVSVQIEPQDLPGETLRAVICESCGELIKDMREVIRDGKILCRPCAEGKAYYEEKA